MQVSVPCKKLNIGFDFKLFENVEVPEWFSETDCIKQYVGIWKVMLNLVLQTQAKKVLEFGTREGYSTRLWSEFLRHTQGHLWTVDLAEPKIVPEVKAKLDNVSYLQMDVRHVETIFKDAVDILYIDDWHNGYHLYSELERYAHQARVVAIHDVSQDCHSATGIMPGLTEWCKKEFLPYSVYTFNACGLAVIEVEKFRGFYA